MNEDGSIPEARAIPIFHAGDYPPGYLRRAEQRGELVRLTRSRYAPAAKDGKNWKEREALELAKIRAVAASAPPGNAISGWHAALLHGIPVLDYPEVVQVVSPKRVCSYEAIGYQRSFRPLPEEDLVMIDGILTTAFDRTVLDVLLLGDPAAGVVVIDHVLRAESGAQRRGRRDVSIRVEGVRGRLLDRLDAESLRGTEQARAVIMAGSPLAESPAESLGRRAALVIGLPEPILQMELILPSRRAYPDLTWVIEIDGRKLYIHMEVDGLDKYEGADGGVKAFQAEKRREQEIRALGHRVLRFSWAELREPDLYTFCRRVESVFPYSVLVNLKPRRDLMTELERLILIG